ncbi:hypothetical protein FAUST_6611 [Fusarium austroamericanum]|uniref:Heterokaryon incompatibility domain-containing protein n=1 Tax=Fusarium austroamericanum TaxID=282268 RepID=A0AAN6BZ61_FUSAU|nr:hypothetical protein FAUST_6611 [Fusarium austroamericanum]
MQLINVLTFGLEEFHKNIPEYAILSHTWGNAKDEVSFQEINNPSPEVRLKKGFRKIELCVQQAQLDGLMYCWVDTCCIDKSSSAELSEAINSMFTWYRNSAVCYIYLDDVEGMAPESLSAFRRSRWFTRGWTLQELVAPQTRRFFDMHWSCIGEMSRTLNNKYRVNGFFRVGTEADEIANLSSTTTKFSSWVAEITGIPDRVFYAGDLKSISAATKMSWAAKRETTRIEDQAYCLLGLFDVNMPLLYGEGRDAFIRLQEEILKKAPDHTLFTWGSTASSTPTLSGLLSYSPKNFSSYGCRNLRPKRIGNPYEMTNKGLHLQIRLVETMDDPDEFYAILDVDNETSLGQDYRYSIRLRRLDVWGQYARVHTDAGLRCENESDMSTSIIPSHIYVQNCINHVSPMNLTRNPSKLILGCRMTSMSLAIIGTSGSPSWDPDTFSISPPVSENYYARVALQQTMTPDPSLTMTIGWRIQKDASDNVISHLAALNDPNDLDNSHIAWWEVISSRTHNYFSDLSYAIVNGELVAEITLHDQSIKSFMKSRSPFSHMRKKTPVSKMSYAAMRLQASQSGYKKKKRK